MKKSNLILLLTLAVIVALVIATVIYIGITLEHLISQSSIVN